MIFRIHRISGLVLFMVGVSMAICSARAEQAPVPPGATAEKLLMQGVFVRVRGVSMHDTITAQWKAFKDICELSFKKPLRVFGDRDKVGQMDTYLYMDEDRTAAYTVETMPDPVQPDPCIVNLRERIHVKLMRYDGRQTTVWDFDAQSHMGKKRVVKGRAPLLQYGAMQLPGTEFVDNSSNDGARSLVAGHGCNESKQVTKALVTEICQLRDKNQPAFIQGLPLKFKQTFTNGHVMSDSEVSEVNTNIAIDTGVFKVPGDFREGR